MLKKGFDVVMPNNNEESLIDMALKLGYKELVFLTDKSSYTYKSDRILIKTALLSKSGTLNKQSRHAYVFRIADRSSFEQKADYLLDAENSDMKDSFHYKRTALNQVHAKLAYKNQSAIVFSFSNLLHSTHRERLKILGRMFQNAVLVKKYKLRYDCFSLARNPIEMRSRQILDSLLRALNL